MRNLVSSAALLVILGAGCGEKNNHALEVQQETDRQLAAASELLNTRSASYRVTVVGRAVVCVDCRQGAASVSKDGQSLVGLLNCYGQFQVDNKFSSTIAGQLEIWPEGDAEVIVFVDGDEMVRMKNKGTLSRVAGSLKLSSRSDLTISGPAESHVRNCAKVRACGLSEATTVHASHCQVVELNGCACAYIEDCSSVQAADYSHAHIKNCTEVSADQFALVKIFGTGECIPCIENRDRSLVILSRKTELERIPPCHPLVLVRILQSRKATEILIED